MSPGSVMSHVGDAEPSAFGLLLRGLGSETMATIAEELRAEGRACGFRDALRFALLEVLCARGFEVGNDVLDEVVRCTDQERLKGWIGRAETASCLSDIFPEREMALSPSPRDRAAAFVQSLFVGQMIWRWRIEALGLAAEVHLAASAEERGIELRPLKCIDGKVVAYEVLEARDALIR